MNFEEVENNREMYQERMDEQTPDGITLGSVLLPDEDTDPELLDVFHKLMTDEGFIGIEYTQEALHAEGGDYFTRLCETPETVREDFQQYKELAG